MERLKAFTPEIAQVLTPQYWQQRLKANEGAIKHMEDKLPIFKADAELCRKALESLK